MTEILGGNLPVFVALTLILFGGGAFLTGQALAEHWRPGWMVAPASLGLALSDRLLTVGLFGGRVLSLGAFMIAFAYLAAVMLAAWRLTMAHKMVTQYPWLYARAGLFSWRAGESR